MTETYDRELVANLNAAARTGRYRAALWMERTGKSVEDLDAEWRKSLEEPQTEATPDTPPSTMP